MYKIIIVIAIVVGSFYFYKYNIKYPYRYIGYFYPSINDMNKWDESDPLPSLESCQNWVDRTTDYYTEKDKKFDIDNFDYECGKDCYKGDPYNQGVTYTCSTSVQ